MIPAMSNENAFRVAVGELAQQSAVLESVVTIITWGIVGVTDTVGRIALPNSVDRSTRIIRDVAPHRISDAGLLSELNDWLSAVTRAYQDRNTILHSVWIGPADDSPHFKTSTKPLPRDPESRKADEVLAVAAELELLATTKVADIIRRLPTAAPGPWVVY